MGFKEYSFIIHCSNCNNELVDIWVTGEGPTYNIRAICPHCGDKSFWKKIEGKFSMGNTNSTDLGPVNYSENTVEISCRKK